MRRSFESYVFHRLSGFREIQKERLQEYLEERIRFVRLLAQSREVAEIIAFAAEVQSSGAIESEDLSGRRYGHWAQRAHKRLTSDEAFAGLEDLVLFAPDQPTIIYAAREGLKTATDDPAYIKRIKTLESGWKLAGKKGSPVLADIAFYEPSAKPCLFIGTPGTDDEGRLSAVLVAVLSTNHLKHIVEEKTGLGLTGEAYLVGPDGTVRTPSRFLTEEDILKKKVETEAVRRALAGEKGQMILTDYRGKEVLSAFTPLGLKETASADFDWALLVEMDADEAFTAVTQLAFRYVLLTMILAVCAVVAGFFTARAIVSPLRKLRAVMAGQNIREASVQDTEAARQLEMAVRGLERLSLTLTEVSSRLRT